jgi:hypothetical protein
LDFTQFPIVQGGAVAVLLAVLWLVYTGRLVPRSTLEDVRKDRDDRIAEAERDTERGWKLYEKEMASHALTRRALLDQALGVTAPALALTETAEKILTELQEPGSADG